MSTEFQYDVFLSHNSVDKPRVQRLAERLRLPDSITSLEVLTSQFPMLVIAVSRSCWPTARGFRFLSQLGTRQMAPGCAITSP